MSKLSTVKEGDAAASHSGAELFRILWEELGDLLGTTAAAVLLDRATRRVRGRSRELDELRIARVDGDFAYRTPPAFARARGPTQGLCLLRDELRPLLVELTGQVAVRHLESVPELRHWTPGPRASN